MATKKVQPKAKVKAKATPKAKASTLPKFSLEKALKAISERAEDAPDLSEGIGRVDPNTPEVERRRIRQLEAAILVQIAGLQNEPESSLKTTRMNVALDRLGELRAEQGDYAGAMTLTHDPRRRDHYKQIKKALERKNSKVCDCPSPMVRDGRGVAALSPRFKLQTILTEKGTRNLMMCATCKLMYVE